MYPLYLANEGKIVAVVPAEQVGDALAALRRDPLGTEAALIGRIERGEPRPGHDAHRLRRPSHRRHAGRRAIAAHLLRF
jgi:hydrogenase expression/formation protein HypE